MRVSQPRAIVASCVLALCALALIVWSVVDPRPVPVILAMSVGQVIGTMSFVAFLWVVVVDLRHARATAAKESADDGSN